MKLTPRLLCTLLLLAGAWHTPAPAQAQAHSAIFFLGDGMGPATVTAARIYRYGESGWLHMESLPRTARVRTHSRNAQTTDSAPSMSAYMTGVKMNNDVISMSADTVADLSRCTAGNGVPVPTLLELAKAAGKGTGVVTTTRLTHATPAATYAHICHRDLENEIAAQAVPGTAAGNAALLDGVDVLLGGGRQHFLPQGTTGSKRTDRRDLIAELQAKGYGYAADAAALHALLGGTGKLLGLFAVDHMSFELDRDPLVQPSLAEMTSAALNRLSKNPKGYFLMIEGGRIDHALHNTNARRAVTDTVAFDDAIQAALDRVDLSRTLVVVAADHDHTLVINGYSKRSGPVEIVPVTGRIKTAGVLGLVHDLEKGAPAKDAEGMPYSILGFGNGENRVGGPRARAPALTDDITTARDYHQEAGVRHGVGEETHGSGDVMLMATGAGAQQFKGTIDNTVVFSLLRRALGL